MMEWRDTFAAGERPAVICEAVSEEVEGSWEVGKEEGVAGEGRRRVYWNRLEVGEWWWCGDFGIFGERVGVLQVLVEMINDLYSFASLLLSFLVLSFPNIWSRVVESAGTLIIPSCFVVAIISSFPSSLHLHSRLS